MAFIKVRSITGGEVSFDRFTPADGLTVKEGQLLINSGDGRVVNPIATSIPDFVSIQNMDPSSPQTNKCTMIRIESNDEYECKTALTFTPTSIGTRVTLTTDGLGVTTTTTGGVFLISATDGKTNSSTIRGFFRR